MNVREEIDAFRKLGFEAQFQKISSGGAVSYVEVTNLNNNLDAIEQIVDSEQLNTIGVIMKYVENNLMGKDLTLIEIADKVIEDINDNLINIDRTKGGYGSLATVRKQELISAYNRFRKLRVKK